MILRFLRYLSRFVEDGKTGNPSVKRFGLALAVTVLSGVMLGIGLVICYVTAHAEALHMVELVRILSGTLELLAGLVLTAVTTGYLVGRAQNGKGSEDDEDECEATEGEFNDKRKITRRAEDSKLPD